MKRIIKVELLPEVVHKLSEFVSSLGQRNHDVNRHVGRLHQLTFHFHQWAKGPEENQPAKFQFVFTTEGQFIQRAFVFLCACDACGHETR